MSAAGAGVSAVASSECTDAWLCERQWLHGRTPLFAGARLRRLISSQIDAQRSQEVSSFSSMEKISPASSLRSLHRAGAPAHIHELGVIEAGRRVGDAQPLVEVDRAVAVVLALVVAPIGGAGGRQIEFARWCAASGSRTGSAARRRAPPPARAPSRRTAKASLRISCPEVNTLSGHRNYRHSGASGRCGWHEGGFCWAAASPCLTGDARASLSTLEPFHPSYLCQAMTVQILERDFPNDHLPLLRWLIFTGVCAFGFVLTWYFGLFHLMFSSRQDLYFGDHHGALRRDDAALLRAHDGDFARARQRPPGGRACEPRSERLPGRRPERGHGGRRPAAARARDRPYPQSDPEGQTPGPPSARPDAAPARACGRAARTQSDSARSPATR